MLWEWQTRVNNYKNSGYDVIAISPIFPPGPNTHPDGSIGHQIDNTGTSVPYWGTGRPAPNKDPFVVDYRQTSRNVWGEPGTSFKGAFKKYRPIAVMSFSRHPSHKGWILEETEYNRPKMSWVVELDYTDIHGNPQTGRWPRPYAGGTPQDYSPYRGTGARALLPPNPSRNADDPFSTNLPTQDIIQRINDYFHNPGRVRADHGLSAGNFISGYMAYHGIWYREWTNANLPANEKCLFAGHTHVGTFVSRADAAQAVKLQLDALIAVLP
jgi:hypothetical protein